MSAPHFPPPPAATLAHDPIPVSLITGFLGSGKTTLLNHLLASPGMESTAVLINEFGEVGIDHLIVRELDEGVVLLKSGCICCTVQGELVDGLKELYMKRLAGTLPAFTRVAIETTGLADPLPIIACLMRDPLFKHVYRLGGLVTTVDAIHGEAQLDRHVEAVRQAAVADRLVITKSDLADDPEVALLRARLEHLNPAAPVLVALHGAVGEERLLDTSPFDPESKSDDVRRWLEDEAGEAHEHEHSHPVDVNRHDERIASFCITLDEPLPWEAFEEWFGEFAERHADHILRVKGLLDVPGEAGPLVVHCVQSTQHLPTRLAAWPDDDRRSRIVFITHDLPRTVVETSLREHLARLESFDSPRNDAPETHAGRGIWLNEAELSRIFLALSRGEDRVAANALRFMLLTGQSCEDVRAAQWQELDLERRVWLKPAPLSSKASSPPRPHRIRLGDAAMMLIGEVRAESEGAGGFVFRHAGGGIPLDRLDAVWSAAARQAGAEETSLEAFRPVLAAALFRGLSPALTRRLLGLRPG